MRSIYPGLSDANILQRCKRCGMRQRGGTPSEFIVMMSIMSWGSRCASTPGYWSTACGVEEIVRALLWAFNPKYPISIRVLDQTPRAAIS